MKILVPTDFSALSNTASHYAATMADQLHAEVVLIHVVSIVSSPRTQVAFHVTEIEDRLADNAKQDCIRLAHELTSKFAGLNVSYTILKGYPVEAVIENYAVHHGIDYIVMGTHGATGLQKALFGSNAAAVISHSTIPVITVPAHARYTGIRTIVFATDAIRTEDELPTLIAFAELFRAAIRILHVVPPASYTVIDVTGMEADMKAKFNYPGLSVQVSRNEDILQGIESYVAEHAADMIVMFTYKYSFFEKLFGKSITRQMAFHTRTPLLSIKKSIR